MNPRSANHASTGDSPARRKWRDFQDWQRQQWLRGADGKTPIFDDATSMARLHEGFARVRANGGGPGGDGQTVEQFATNLERRLQRLHTQLRNGTYEPGPARLARLRKKSGGWRVLTIPCVADRVAQTAALLALQARAEAEFEDVSFAYRPGRSVRAALAMVRQLHRHGYEWVVDADIHAFFDEVPHVGVLAALARLAPEPPLIALVEKWLALSRFAGRGLPQGAPLSPLLANLYLDHLDEVLAEAGFRLVRYADDFVILCRKEARAERALRFVADLLREMGLRLNPEKTIIRHLDEGYRFLGEDIHRTTLARQLRELEDAAEDLPDDMPDEAPAGAAGQELSGQMRVPASRRMLGKDYARGDGPAATDIAALDDPLGMAGEAPSPAEGLEEDDEPPPLEPAEDPDARVASRHAPFIRPLYLTGARQRLAPWQASGLAVYEDDRLLGVVHARLVDRIDIFPGADAETEALRRAAQMRIPVFLVAASGKVEAALTPAPAMRAGLHLAQARHALDGKLALELARRFVYGRIYNARRLLQRLRNRLDKTEHAALRARLEPVIDKLRAHAINAARKPGIDTLDKLRGVEAAAARLYWPALAALLRRGMAEKHFRRVRMPAGSPFNTVLNWTAALLRRDMETLLIKRDVHPGFGVLHTVNDSRRALVFDLMEEFRAPLAEALAIRVLSKGIVGREHFATFRIDGREGVWLVNGGAARVARAWEKLMDAPVKDPASGERTTWRGMMNRQLSAYIDHVLGAAAYEPYLMDM